MQHSNFILDLLSIHFSEPEVTEYTSQLFPIDNTSALSIVKLESILYLIFLNQAPHTISSESLLLMDDPFPFC